MQFDNFNEINISINNIIGIYDACSEIPWKKIEDKKYDTDKRHIYKLVFLTSGKFTTEYSNKILNHEPNAFIFSHEFQLPSIRYTTEVPIFNYGIVFDTFMPIPEVFDDTVMHSIYPKNPEYILNQFKKALNLQITRPFLWNISVKMIILDLIKEYVYSLYKIEQKKTVPDYLKKSIDYIRANACNEEININELAKRHHISVNHFIKMFNEYYDTSPKKYINTIRLNKAANLLSSTNKSIYEISCLAGFNNLSHFNVLFKNKFEITPSKYRERYNIWS